MPTLNAVQFVQYFKAALSIIQILLHAHGGSRASFKHSYDTITIDSCCDKCVSKYLPIGTSNVICVTWTCNVQWVYLTLKYSFPLLLETTVRVNQNTVKHENQNKLKGAKKLLELSGIVEYSDRFMWVCRLVSLFTLRTENVWI